MTSSSSSSVSSNNKFLSDPSSSNSSRPASNSSNGGSLLPAVTPDAKTGKASSCLISNDTDNSQQQFPEVIKLDVGGHKFTTSRTTLCSMDGSHLASMFSGRHSNAALRNEDGSYFIDRDGR